MSNLFETVLLVGATSGIGEELARQYHARGKKVVISGRRADRLERLKAELPGIEAIKVSQHPFSETIGKAISSSLTRRR